MEQGCQGGFTGREDAEDGAVPQRRHSLAPRRVQRVFASQFEPIFN